MTFPYWFVSWLSHYSLSLHWWCFCFQFPYIFCFALRISMNIYFSFSFHFILSWHALRVQGQAAFCLLWTTSPSTLLPVLGIWHDHRVILKPIRLGGWTFNVSDVMFYFNDLLDRFPLVKFWWYLFVLFDLNVPGGCYGTANVRTSPNGAGITLFLCVCFLEHCIFILIYFNSFLPKSLHGEALALNFFLQSDLWFIESDPLLHSRDGQYLLSMQRSFIVEIKLISGSYTFNRSTEHSFNLNWTRGSIPPIQTYCTILLLSYSEWACSLYHAYSTAPLFPFSAWKWQMFLEDGRYLMTHPATFPFTHSGILLDDLTDTYTIWQKLPQSIPIILILWTFPHSNFTSMTYLSDYKKSTEWKRCNASFFKIEQRQRRDLMTRNKTLHQK